MKQTGSNVIEITGLKNYLGDNWVHDELNLTVKRGEIIAIIGGSGCGKTTLLRTILMLREQTAGSVKVFGIDTREAGPKAIQSVRQRWGVMFQQGALFSSLNVLENVMFPMSEFAHLHTDMKKQTALLKIMLTGLAEQDATKYPSELSGGMLKRVAIARAIAMDPELVFLDEPTAGLDPSSADELDDLVLHLRDNLGITFMIITHDLDTLWKVPDKVAFIGEGKILALAPIKELMQHDHPLIRAYFSGARSRARDGQ